jgi:hypothetical protein
MKFFRAGIEPTETLGRSPSRLRCDSFPALITVFPVFKSLHKTFTLLSQRSVQNGVPPSMGCTPVAHYRRS